jgi:hypothetical protein
VIKDSKMTIQVMLSISEELYQQYLLLAQIIGRDVAELMTAKLEDRENVGVEQLSNAEVLRLADAKMPTDQDQRLHDLLELNGEGKLDAEGLQELDRLMDIYDRGNLLKVQGLSEAIRRGLREPIKR